MKQLKCPFCGAFDIITGAGTPYKNEESVIEILYIYMDCNYMSLDPVWLYVNVESNSIFRGCEAFKRHLKLIKKIKHYNISNQIAHEDSTFKDL